MKNIMPPINTPDNAFHDGNPATGEQGTIVPGLWLNNSQDATRNIQQELISVLTGAEIEIDEAKNNQLLTAILSLITASIPGLPAASLTQAGIVKLISSLTSDSESLAATAKAVKLVANAIVTSMSDHIQTANPHHQYLAIANFLSEIKDAGPAAVAQTLLNLGLGDAAKLGVATDAEVIAGLVGKAITAATLKSRFASVVLYPSGTEAVPPTLTAGQRIVIDNPFPGRPVSAEVEVFANGIWDSPNIMVAPQGNGGPSAGAKAKYLFDSDKIVIQTAGNGVLYLSIYSGSAHNFLSGGDVFSGTIFSARQYRLRVRTL
ncbi:TPA: phage tail protein [Yersinia enterocolitica]